MPSDLPVTDPLITGRCYCGATTLAARQAPQVVAYCHCADCRRWTGAPVGAFAAFGADDLEFTPRLGPGYPAVEGVDRRTCNTCGSPLAARFDYLPGQVYVPVGLLDQANDWPPSLHCHADARLGWLQITDDLPRKSGTARNILNRSDASRGSDAQGT